MKLRFSTLDIVAILPELKARICTGWRVNQVFDCDYKTYIFKLNKSIVQMKKDNDTLNVNEETENKMTFIIESGLRIHSTEYDWPKSPAPNQFATKLRKHLRNKRVEDIRQVGIDRVIDIRFGSQQLANHLIIELYDRGNLILTDHEYVIIAILRWRKQVDSQKKTSKDMNDDNLENNHLEETDGFKVGQNYPIDKCRQLQDLEVMNEEKIAHILRASTTVIASNASYKKRQKPKQTNKDDGLHEINLKNLFNPHVVYGSSLLEDKLIKYLIADSDTKPQMKAIVKIPFNDMGQLDEAKLKEIASIVKKAFDEAEQFLKEVQERDKSPGYLVQKKQIVTSISDDRLQKDKRVDKYNKSDNEKKPTLITNVDFFPILTCAQRKVQQEFNQKLEIEEFESFDKAVDIYYTSLESQKLDSKSFGAEKEARKRLENLKIAQEKKLDDLARSQKEDEVKARLIELNCEKVENALLIVRSMIANQMSWSDISATIKEAQEMNDTIACLITGVKFDRNEFSMRLNDPYDDDIEAHELELESDNKTNKDKKHSNKNKQSKMESNSRSRVVDIDIGLSAHANARKFFDRRRTAVDKERKTVEVSKKAYKNVERKTKEMLKDVVVKTNITRARKRYWFENFIWFISSEGYLVVAGRDAEQNDLLVKRYMKTNDIYVHAELHGASSVIIKNELTTPIPPKTLTEAGTFAVCNSSAWEAKIVSASWWVYPNQVSKSAPTGEYLSSGAFIIRGKKNYLPIANLVLGFGFLFRLDEESIERRKIARLLRETTAGDKQINSKPCCEASTENSDIVHSQNENLTQQEPAGDSDDDKSDNDSDESDKHQIKPEPEVDYEEEEDDDDKSTEHRLIDTMTEFPEPDDTLLYAIPMCGPYVAFHSFKYKVKVIPGTNKRGKAAKTSLGIFMHDKRASQREKDLLRALKDQDYARNVPNKVKISAPNMNAIVKKKPKKSEVRLPIRR